MNLLRRCAEVTESLFYRSVFDEMCRGSVEGGLIPVEENDVLFFTTHPIDEPFPLPADLRAQMTVFVQSHPKFGIHILPRNKKNGKKAKRVTPSLIVAMVADNFFRFSSYIVCNRCRSPSVMRSSHRNISV